MSKPIDVTIVPERLPWEAAIGKTLAIIIDLFFKSWIVMLLLGAFTPFAPAYGTVLVVLCVIRLAWPKGEHLNFTSWWRSRRTHGVSSK